MREVTAQAFYKARVKISALAFTPINAQRIALVDKHLEVSRWRGLRVVAGDGSKVRLTLLNKGVRSIAEGVAFGLYLPGIELFLDFVLHEPLFDERQMLFEAIDAGVLQSDDLLVLDRGFPSRWLVSMLTVRKLLFCIRCDHSAGFTAVRCFLASGLDEKVVCLRPPSARDAAYYGCPLEPTQVRLIRVVTPKGRVHVLMTSLFDVVAYPASEFAALYHGRWRIEEAFKRLKHRLGLEYTSGLSGHAARQDFGAKAVCDHLNALAAYAATDACLNPDSDAKINRTQAFDKLKRQLGRWLLRAKATVRNVKAVLKELAKNLQYFVPDRLRPRDQKVKPHGHFAYKPT